MDFPPFDRADHLLTDAVYAAYATAYGNNTFPWGALMADTRDDGQALIQACYQRGLCCAHTNYLFSVALDSIREHFKAECVALNAG